MSEKKFKTRPKDFTGCHVDIAEAIKHGLTIECRVKDTPESEWLNESVTVSDFVVNGIFKYRTTWNGKESDRYRYAEPVKIKTAWRKKKASEVVKWLEDNGYKYIVNKYVWEKQITSIMDGYISMTTALQRCGDVVEKIPSGEPADWYEEIEVE